MAETVKPSLRAVIVLGGGKSTRCSCTCRKQFALIRGRPLLYWAVLFASMAAPKTLIVLPMSDDVAPASYMPEGVSVLPTAPGNDRLEGVRIGLSSLTNVQENEYVIVHDGARPLLTKADVDALMGAASHGYDAIGTAQECEDTIEVANTFPDRRACRRSVTPQLFRLAALQEAVKKQHQEFNQLHELLCLFPDEKRFMCVRSGRALFKVTWGWELGSVERMLLPSLGGTVLVTGGTRGIGRATAVLLLDMGFRVVVLARNEALFPQKVIARPEFRSATADVTHRKQLQAVVQQHLTEEAPLIAVVNCAGIGAMGSLTGVEDSELFSLMTTNSVGALHVAQVALNLFPAGINPVIGARGIIINVGSSVLEGGRSNQTAYAMSKAVIPTLAAQLAVEHPDVLNFVVVPRRTDTDLRRAVAGRQEEGLATPDEVASTICTVLLESNKFRNGQSLFVR